MTFRSLLAALCLSACSGGELGLELSGQAAAGQVSYVGPTLAQARRDFFGDDDGAGSGPGSGAGEGGGAAGGFGLDEAVNLRAAPPSVTAVSVTQRGKLGQGWHLRSALTLAHDQALASLPEGLGVLTDPMQVEISAEAAAVQVTLGRRQDLSRLWSLDYAAGLGLQHVATKAHLQSALIDLRTRVNLTQPYAVVSGRLAHAAGFGLTGDVMVFQTGAAEYRLGLVQAF